MNTAEKNEEGAPKGKSPKDWHKYWQSEMDAANKRFRTFLKQGNTINDRYLDERAGNDDMGFSSDKGQIAKLNLFHSNVNTVMDMLHGQTPKIDVKREFDDPDDDVARVAAVILQRMLEVDVRNFSSDVSSVYRAALQDRLIPGLGVARVRYDFGTTKVTTLNPKTQKAEETPKITFESAPIEYAHWQDCRWGWSRSWSELPWFAFRSWLTKDEVTKRFSAKVARNLEYKQQLPEGDQKTGGATDSEKKNNIQKAEVWEIWSKSEQRVFWWSQGAEFVLDSQKDPLKLDGFWPMPKPLMANVTTTMMMPQADFIMAQDLYSEIDELYSRIVCITRAIKVVGVYDQAAGGSVGRMLKEGHENDLIPVENWAMFSEKGGLKGSIDWFPVETVVATLQTLRQILSETIELLYQITGMSDIMRGANTDQYTSDGTNQLKAKMGSISIQALQDEFARFASDLEALKAEIIAKHFSISSIAQQSGAQFLPQADQDKIMPALELIKSPDIKWRVNIKPESLSMVDYAQLKSERTEYLTAMSTFIQSAGSMVKAVPGSMPILLEFMKFGLAGFKGSDYMEGMLDQAIEQAKKAPPPGQDDGKAKEGEVKIQLEQMKQQGDQAKMQGELQKIQAKAQADTQTLQAKLQGELQKIQVDASRDMTLEQTQSQNRLIEIMKELESDLAQIQASFQADMGVEEAQASYDIQSQQVEHVNNLREIKANGKMETGIQRGDSDK